MRPLLLFAFALWRREQIGHFQAKLGDDVFDGATGVKW
jgi:hypothetical protein